MAQAIPIDSILARVGALPVLLRAILGAERAGARRIVVISNRMVSACVPEELRRTRRLPGNMEWRATAEGDIAPVLRDIADSRAPHRVDRRGQNVSSLLASPRCRMERDESFGIDHRRSAGGDLRLQHSQAIEVLKRCPSGHRAAPNCSEWLTADDGIVCESVPADQWQ